MTITKGSPKPPDAGVGDMAWSMFPNPALSRAVPSDHRAVDREEIILTACGFTLGFGWLWFPFLSAHWLPAFLWGGPFTGGGASLFIALLTGGFLLCGLICLPISVAPPSTPPSPDGSQRGSPGRSGQSSGLVGYQRAHAVVILVAALELPSAWSAWEIPPELRVAALAAAALSMGIFWGGRLLSLPPRQAGWAMAAASVIGLSLAIPLPGCPFTSHGLCLALPLALAWGAAWRLDYLQKKPGRNPSAPEAAHLKKQAVRRAGACRPGHLPGLMRFWQLPPFL